MRNNRPERPGGQEIERLKGRMLVLETAVGKLVWRCARMAPNQTEWLNFYRAALCGAQHAWEAAPPLGRTAMAEAESRLGEILHALDEGRLTISARRDAPAPQPRADQGAQI